MITLQVQVLVGCQGKCRVQGSIREDLTYMHLDYAKVKFLFCIYKKILYGYVDI